VTTKWSKRGQATRQPVPNLAVLAPGRVNSSVPGPGKPVPDGTRGTRFADRNPMFDSEPKAQDEGRDPIRPSKRLKGVA
jgi:hypothetical protein